MPHRASYGLLNKIDALKRCLVLDDGENGGTQVVVTDGGKQAVGHRLRQVVQLLPGVLDGDAPVDPGVTLMTRVRAVVWHQEASV